MEPSARWRYEQACWTLGLLGLWLFAGLSVLWPEVGSPAETIMALTGLIAVLAVGKGIRGSAPLWLLLAAIVVQVLSWTLGYFHHPEWVADNPQVDRLAKLFIFIGVAWWLRGSIRHTLILWGLALIGYLLATWLHGGGWQEWVAGLQGQRVGFGIRNMQHGSMLFGVAFLGLVVLARRFLAVGRFRLGRSLLWLALMSVCLLGIVIGQTRAVWLALLVALPVTGLAWLAYVARQKGGRRMLKLMVGGLALVGVVVLLVGVTFKDTLTARLDVEAQVIAQIATGETEDLPYSSIGIRIHTWKAALEWIQERPLVGWGGQGRSLVIDHTEWLPDRIKQEFGHLHNFFLEIWVAYGALGVAVIAALAVWVGRATWLAWRGGAMPGDMALFGAGFFVYWVIVNQFESYNSFSTGVFVHNLVVGGLVTHYWRWKLEQGRQESCWLPHRPEYRSDL